MSHGKKIAVVGLGYVGLPLAVALARKSKLPVLGVDIKKARIDELNSGHDATEEVQESLLKDALKEKKISFSADPQDLKKSDFIIVAVPTPVDSVRRPDLSPLIAASRTVGKNLSRGTVVVFESTVYPGATEEDCVPVLEKESGLKCGVDFFVGYSPERMNPGDKEHTVEKIVKVVSGMNPATLEIVASVYASIVEAGIYKAPSIRVAEAAKVIENTQRDLNIALMNELAIIFDRMGIDTLEVLKAAGTKWNFLPFRPGLVGGHCIGVDPYYLTFQAEKYGYHPQVILAGRKINDGMGAYVAQRVIKSALSAGIDITKSPVTILGLTFKEDVSDLRNTRVVDIAEELKSFGVRIQIADPKVDPAEAHEEYGIDLKSLDKLEPSSIVILAVGHRAYKSEGWALIRKLTGDAPSVVADLKGVLNPLEKPAKAVFWRL